MCVSDVCAHMWTHMKRQERTCSLGGYSKKECACRRGRMRQTKSCAGAQGQTLGCRGWGGRVTPCPGLPGRSWRLAHSDAKGRVAGGCRSVCAKGDVGLLPAPPLWNTRGSLLRFLCWLGATISVRPGHGTPSVLPHTVWGAVLITAAVRVKKKNCSEIPPAPTPVARTVLGASRVPGSHQGSVVHVCTVLGRWGGSNGCLLILSSCLQNFRSFW